MDRFTQLQTFVAVANANSFSAAARKLGASPPAVTRTISLLEDRLGTKLFHRTTRQVSLTSEGELFLAEAERILIDLGDVEAAISGGTRQPVGLIRMTGPVWFGERFIAPVLSELLSLHSQLSVDLVLLDRVVNMVEEGFDLALRIGDLPDSELVARRVGTVRRIVVASPKYLAQHGMPQSISDLSDHEIIQASGAGEKPVWRFEIDGKPASVRLRSRYSLSSNRAVLDAVMAHHGLAQLMSYQVADALRSGDVASVLDHIAPRSLPVHLMQVGGRQSAARLRIAVSAISTRLKSHPDLLPGAL